MEVRAVRAYGLASLLRGLAVGFGFGMLGGIVLDGYWQTASTVLCVLAVVCLVSARLVTVEFDE